MPRSAPKGAKGAKMVLKNQNNNFFVAERVANREDTHDFLGAMGMSQGK